MLEFNRRARRSELTRGWLLCPSPERQPRNPKITPNLDAHSTLFVVAYEDGRVSGK